MNAIALIDLGSSLELDRKAQAAIKGGAEWQLNSSSVATGNWSGYALTSNTYIGTTFHDGYLCKEYNEGFKRTRTQTESSNWEHFVRV